MTVNLADHLRDAAVACDYAAMPTDPFEADDLLDACKALGGAVVALAARVRAERVANAEAWAAFDPYDKPPPTKPTKPVDPPPDPEPEPDPPPDNGGDQ